MKTQSDLSIKIALSGSVTALSFVLMMITSVIPVGTYAFPAIAGALLCVLVIEFGQVWAWSSFAAVSLLALFLCTDKEAALYYVAFFGFYPIIKAKLEQMKNKYLQWVLKFLVFNVCIVAAFYISIYLLGVPTESFTVLGFYVPVVFLVAGNVVFILYDILISRIIALYVNRLRRMVFKNFNR